MSLPGAKTVKKFSRWLRARVMSGALILGYHRIHAVEEDFYQVCVSPENFARHMEVLSELAHPISLSKLVQGLKQNILPPKSVVVTFDDGYADNLHVAKPILEKYDIPATVFICTGYLGREFWWDELERLVLCSGADLPSRRLRVGRAKFQWEPPQANTEIGNPEVHRQFCRALYHFLLPLDVQDQKQAMGVIRSWFDMSSPGISTPRAMSEEELLRLVDGGLIELGAHTSHHLVLPQLSFERQKEEIQSSKRDLEALLGEKVAGFSYPNGQATVDAKRLVREMGFTYACTSLHDVVRPGSDVYELTRFWQKDVDGNRFVRGLNRWMRMGYIDNWMLPNTTSF
jgi:peptidoglycan/xylan/chitin deacetylase (PgdA/CDA1 family)